MIFKNSKQLHPFINIKEELRLHMMQASDAVKMDML